MMKASFCSRILAIAAGAFIAGTVTAQVQPPVAENQQDEVINLNRPVNEDTEYFSILRSDDKFEVNKYVTKVYYLEHANPYEMLPYLRTVAALERGSVITAWNPQDDGVDLSWIQVNVPEFQIPYLDQAVKAYDVPGFASIPGDVKFSYRTKYRDADEIADHIRSTTLSPDGLIRADAATNTIYVQDSPSDFRRVLAQIQFYDIPIPQIDVELTMIELTEVDQSELGLDWDAWKTALGGSASFEYMETRTDPNGPGVTESDFSKFSGLLSLDATVLARFLNYLVDEGKAEIYTRTDLTISNGRTVALSTQTQIPEYRYVDGPRGHSELKEVSDNVAPPVDEGVTLLITPNISMNAARMDVDVIVTNPVAIDKTGSPIYSTQDFSTNLTLSQEQLYRIGGIKRKVEAKETKGLPLIKEVPVIKWLVSHEETILRDKQLYVFLRPKWSAPLIPEMDSMKVWDVLNADQIEHILMENPNIAMSQDDAELLQMYLNAQAEDN